MKKITLGLATIALTIASCNRGAKENKTERVFDVNVNLENDFINIENTRVHYNSHSGEYYSSVDSIVQYGAGYLKQIDDSLKGYNLDIIVNAWVREFEAPAEGYIAISANKADNSTKDWAGLKVKAGNFKEKEWIQLSDTFKYNADFLNDVNVFKIFALKPNGKDHLDVDDLRIKYIFYK